MIAKEIIDFIKQRTEKGLDKNNRKFSPYSKSYKKSLDFKLAGKSSKVDLELTGEMLAEMDLLTERSGSITIGYEADNKDLNGKVEGNRKGTYGNKKPVTKPRDFLGIHEDDLKKILRKYPAQSKTLQERIAELIKASAAAGEILDMIALRSKGGGVG